MRPDVLKFYLDEYKRAIEQNVLPLLEERGGDLDIHVDLEVDKKRAEKLSKKYLAMVAKRRENGGLKVPSSPKKAEKKKKLLERGVSAVGGR
jgi:hypothetical protein